MWYIELNSQQRYISLHPILGVTLVNVLESELQEDALRRWELAKSVAKKVNGVLYGSMAAMIVAGLPRLPRDADIAVNWSLEEFLEWFKVFEREDWYFVQLARTGPETQALGGPRYGFVLLEERSGFYVNIVSMHVEQNRQIDAVALRFDKSEYVHQKKRKLLEGRPTILDVLVYSGLRVNRRGALSILSPRMCGSES